jgi:hypothetical protein
MTTATKPAWWLQKRAEQPARCVVCGGKTWRRLSPDVGVHKACELPKEDRR